MNESSKFDSEGRISCSWGRNYRRIVLAIFLFVCLIPWTGGCLFLLWAGVSQFDFDLDSAFIFLFTLPFCLAMLWADFTFLCLLFEETKFELNREGLTFTRALLGFRRENFIPLEEIKLFAEAGSQSSAMPFQKPIAVKLKNSRKPLYFSVPSDARNEILDQCRAFLESVRNPWRYAEQTDSEDSEALNPSLNGSSRMDTDEKTEFYREKLASWNLADRVPVTGQPFDSEWQREEDEFNLRVLKVWKYGTFSWKNTFGIGFAAFFWNGMTFIPFLGLLDILRVKGEFEAQDWSILIFVLLFFCVGMCLLCFFIFELFAGKIKTIHTLTRTKLRTEKMLGGIRISRTKIKSLAETKKLALYSDTGNDGVTSLWFETEDGEASAVWELQESDARWIVGMYCHWAQTPEF